MEPKTFILELYEICGLDQATKLKKIIKKSLNDINNKTKESDKNLGKFLKDVSTKIGLGLYGGFKIGNGKSILNISLAKQKKFINFYFKKKYDFIIEQVIKIITKKQKF